MCISFLNFVSTFIEDLLTANMHSNDVLRIAQKPFKPCKAIEFVIDLFKPHLKYKGVSLGYKLVDAKKVVIPE